jgi:hypothetical protein
MTGWRQRGDIWQLEAERPSRGTVEFIGGSYLAATPQLSYRRLLEALAAKGWRIRAWTYVPGFDHQDQANTAWRRFRQLRDADGDGGDSSRLMLRLGHSLGCKLHLLAPDGGRGAAGLVALSFNNFSAERHTPAGGARAAVQVSQRVQSLTGGNPAAGGSHLSPTPQPIGALQSRPDRPKPAAAGGAAGSCWRCQPAEGIPGRSSRPR